MTMMSFLISTKDKRKMYFYHNPVQSRKKHLEKHRFRRYKCLDASRSKENAPQSLVLKNTRILPPRCVFYIGVWCLKVQKRSLTIKQNQ
jgi:hypothetical protein